MKSVENELDTIKARDFSALPLGVKPPFTVANLDYGDNPV